MKKMKQEIERLSNLPIKPKIELRIDSLQHMRCKTAFCRDDALMPSEIKERMIVERIVTQMADVIRKKVIKHVDLVETYTFDFWVKE
jgi:hypothetical protein